MQDQNSDKQIRELFCKTIARLTPADFQRVARFEEVGGEAYLESRRWMSLVFGGDREPHNPSLAVEHFFHLWRFRDIDFDLLRHSYRLDGRQLTVIESTSLIAVEAAFNSSDNSSTGSMNDRVSTVANHLFQLVYPIGFVNASSADTLVSRAGCEEHPIVKWTDCILATPLPDRVSFLIHKKDPRQASRPRNLSLWFDDDFRRR